MREGNEIDNFNILYSIFKKQYYLLDRIYVGTFLTLKNINMHHLHCTKADLIETLNFISFFLNLC